MRFDRSLPWLLPFIVGAVALGITGWLWQHERTTTQRALKADFDAGVRQTASRIEERIASYEQMLRGVQGLVRAQRHIDGEQFEGYVDALLSGADFAGIQFFAYAPAQPAAAGAAATARVACVAPATPPNLKLAGTDLQREASRHAAMQLAADSGGLAITAQLPFLIGADRGTQAGFLMFLPVYARGLPLGSVAARRAAIVGWVLAGVRIPDLMSSRYGESLRGIEVRVHDGVDVSPDTLMYASGPRGTPDAPWHYDTLEYIGVGSRTWTLAVAARPEFARQHGGDVAPIIAATGLAFSLLLALLTHQLLTGRQRAREAALAMTTELRASEERYRRIVETANEGIWVTDAEGRTTFVNPKLLLLLDHGADEMLGRRVAAFLDDPHALDAALAAGAQGGELRLRRRDGSLLWVSISTTPIADATGRPAGALTMVADITARKEADAVRAHLEAQLRESQKMEAVGTLAGGIAHDFNNILAAILGNVALARELAGSDAAAATRHLDQIGQAAVRARSLVQQILAFSRRQPHRLVGLALRPIVDESVRLLRPLLPALAELDLVLARAPLMVRADATQLQQVVMNLCTNAWHALGGRAGRIQIGLEAVDLDADAARRLGLAAGRHAHLWVSDNGCGMDEATRLRVFEPFFTTKPVGQGTGLGLAVVHGIVATHGGAIAVTSAPGQGSCFDIHLPLLEAAVPVPAAASASPPQAASEVDASRVLYVDDDPVMVVMVRVLLQRAGFDVTCFEDPRLALADFEAAPAHYDLVVTDFNMPALSGLELAATVLRRRPGLPVVISSGLVSDELIASARRIGVRQVMQKEYTLEQLPNTVRRLLAGAPDLPEPAWPEAGAEPRRV